MTGGGVDEDCIRTGGKESFATIHAVIADTDGTEIHEYLCRGCFVVETGGIELKGGEAEPAREGGGPRERAGEHGRDNARARRGVPRGEKIVGRGLARGGALPILRRHDATPPAR